MLKRLTILALLCAAIVTPAIAADPDFVPRQKDCVGSPPRQTEDPLSPPCVPFFQGDNGGVTYKGVTGDTVTFVLYNDLGISGDLTKPYRPSDDTAAAGDKQGLVRTVKAYVRYFQRRYQTYGRRVLVVGYPSADGPASSCGARASDALKAIAVHRPFGAIVYGANMDCFVTQMAAKDSPSVGLMFGLSKRSLNDLAPYVFTFAPSIEVSASRRAGFLCRKLAGSEARFSTDPTLLSAQRRFGLLYELDARGEADLLVKKAKARCGLEFAAVEPVVDQGLLSGPSTMQGFKARGVSTVTCLCSLMPPKTTVSGLQLAAGSINYRPEWYWDNDHVLDPTTWRYMFPDPAQRAFGSTWFWRQPVNGRATYPYGAYRAEEPGTTPNARYYVGLYYTFLTAFNGVQASGPNLAPHSLRRGMFTFSFSRLDVPTLPAGGFGAYSKRAIGAYAWVDTGMGWWWDPAGTTQGTPGCIRMSREGKRSWSSTWPRGDTDLFTTSAPCSGPLAGASG